MPLYEVNHVLLLPGATGNSADADTPTLERDYLNPGEKVTEQQLIDAGFDGKGGRRGLSHLLEGRHGQIPAISVVPGTEMLDELLRRAAPRNDDFVAANKAANPDDGGQDDNSDGQLSDLEKLSTSELRTLAKERGVSTSGGRADLIAALSA